MEVKPYKNHLSTKNKLMRLLWQVVYVFFFRYTPNILFWKWRIFLLRCFGAKIGKHCKIWSSASFWAPWNLTCENYVAIGPKAQIYNVGKIILATKVVISQNAYLCTASHDIRDKSNSLITSPIIIDSFSWIAADAFISMGVHVGEGAVVGARSAVFKDVEPWTVVGGNPARFLRKRILK